MRRGPYTDRPSSIDRDLRSLSGHRATARGPARAQLVIASMLSLLVISVPLYLLRHPSSQPVEPTLAPANSTFGGVIRPTVDAGTDLAAVVIGPTQIARCSASAGQPGNEGALCDSLPFLEDALRKTISQHPECAPKTGREGTINFVLEVDFNHNRVNVFPGQSGMWRGPQARRSTQCILRNLPTVPFDRLAHRYRYYMIAMMATYPTADPLDRLPDFD